MGPCETCEHPPDWHRLDDSQNLSHTDPAAKFPCIGYDCEADDFDRVNIETCICPDFRQKKARKKVEAL